MRLNNKLEIRLSSLDLKQALMDFLVKNNQKNVSEFMKPNKWHLDYLYRSKEWYLTIDGIYEERNDDPTE